MSPAYENLWNSDEQARIDADIEANRKADASIALGAPAGAKVKVEQLTHEFKFGAHLFNFNQLGSDAANASHQALYGMDSSALFNSATVAFYWRPLEPVEGKVRFDEAEEDTAAWWNACPDPEWQPHWRRPPTEPCVRFCEAKGIRIHGHNIVWGNREWHYPEWLMAKLPHDILAQMLTNDRGGDSILKQPLDVVEKRIPGFAEEVTALTERRFAAIAERYGKRIQSWDVCNESALDFERGNLVPGAKLARGYHKTFMPGDYCHHAFQTAMKVFPKEALLNINDYWMRPAYPAQVKDMLSRGDKIDIMGLQMHLFNPQQCQDLADGVPGAGNDLSASPATIRKTMETVYVPDMPTHLSEITITAPGGDAKGEAIQATITRNLYRIWFSFPQMMGITWWNTVDGCGAPGEPSVSGILHRDGTRKAAYDALDELINHEWKTNLVATADASGAVSFRGFRGSYRLSWTDASGTVQERTLSIA